MRQFLLFFLIANIFVLFSNLQLLLNLSYQTPGFVYPLVHREEKDDYYSYLSYITQGKHEFWLKRAPYTTEKTAPGFFHVYYLVAGKVARIFNFEVSLTYHLVRLASVELFFVGVFFLTRKFLQKGFLLASIVSLIITIPPLFIYMVNIKTTYYPYNYPWFFYLDAFERIYIPPHYMFGQAMLVFSIFLLFQYFSLKKIYWIILSASILFIGAITYPPVILPIGLSVTLASLVYLAKMVLKKINIKEYKHFIIAPISILLVCLLIYKLMLYQMSLGFPWPAAQAYELHYWNYLPSFNDQLFLSFLVPLSLSLPLIFFGFKKLDFNKLFLLFWAFTPFLLLPLVDILGIPKIRLIMAPSFIPFAILIVYFLSLFKNKVSRISIITIILIFSSISLIQYTSIKLDSIHGFLNKRPVDSFRVPQSLYSSFYFIEKNIPKDSHILSSKETGLLIPAFAPTVSFLAHYLETYHFGIKSVQVSNFYSGTMEKANVRKFLLDHQIDYVFFGPYEKSIGGDSFLDYDLFIPVYQNQDISIFKVKKQ